MHAIRDEAVEPGALVNFIEVDERFTFEQDALSVARSHLGTIAVVQGALNQIAGGQQILQSLLILYANGIAAKVIGQPKRRHIHLALEAHLIAREISGLICPEVKLHAALLQSAEYLVGFGIAGLDGLVV